MDDTFLRTMLFDFYGELLTDKQRECYDLHYEQDLSLQEIAAVTGTSRQAVWDLIRRAEGTLREIEAQTGLVTKALRRREILSEIAEIVSTLPDTPQKQEIAEKLKALED